MYTFTCMYICTYANKNWHRASQQRCLKLLPEKEKHSLWMQSEDNNRDWDTLGQWGNTNNLTNSQEHYHYIAKDCIWRGLPLLCHWWSYGRKWWTDSFWPKRATRQEIYCTRSTIQRKNSSKGAKWLRVDLLYCKILPGCLRCQQWQESSMVSKMLRWQRDVWQCGLHRWINNSVEKPRKKILLKEGCFT